MPGRATRRRNPEGGAAALTEAFLGRPARKLTVIEEQLHEHGTLADLARLLALYIAIDGAEFDGARKPKECQKISFDADTRMAFEASGRQLFIVGGDQSLDVREFGQSPEKEFVVIGPVAFVEYFAAKQHLDEEDKTPGPYIHAFSEQSQASLPVLCYDAPNAKCSLAGGSYFIDIDMHGKYSAGIRD